MSTLDIVIKSLAGMLAIGHFTVAFMMVRKNRFPRKPPVACDDVIIHSVYDLLEDAVLPGIGGSVELYATGDEVPGARFAADERDVKVCSYIEARARYQRKWYKKLDLVQLRNLAHQAANSSSFLIYKLRGLTTAMLQTVTVDAKVKKQVLNGELPLSDFPVEYTCDRDSFSAIIVVKSFRRTDQPPIPAKLFMQGLVYQVAELMKDKDKVDFVFPAPFPEVSALLKEHGYEPAGKSAEGFELFSVEVVKMSYQEQLVRALRA